MKKGSGFEKFFKGREKTGAAKKENIRQEKREFRKEREEKIANAKREKRAKYKAANSGEPPKYNLEPPGKKFENKQREERGKPGFKAEKKPFRSGDNKQSPSYRKDSNTFKKDSQSNSGYNRGVSNPSNSKKIELKPKRHNNRTTKPEKWDGPGPDKNPDSKSFSTANSRPAKPEGRKQFSDDKPKGFRDDNRKPFKAGNSKPYNKDERRPYEKTNEKPYRSNDTKPYRKDDIKPYKKDDTKPYHKDDRPAFKSANAKPVIQKKELPKKIGHQDKAGAHLRNETETKAPINRQHKEDELMPLNKYIAHSGVCSRRDAVDLIKGGKVKVNGELILEPGHKVAVSDNVQVAGKKMNPVKDFVYILLNKPKDYITTTDDPQERKTVLDLLKGAPEIRIYPVGRLDRNTSGVLLLTNDGDLSQKLTHPSNEIKKVYAVTLDKPLTKNHFDEILRGITLEDGVANVDTLAFPDAKDLTQIGVEIHSGRNRIVRRIFEQLGYDVKALDRVMFAGLTKKNVDRSKWRYLTEKEVRDLKFFKKGRS